MHTSMLVGCWLAVLPGVAVASERLPYQPWHESQPLEGPTRLAPLGPAPYAQPEEYARRRFEAGVATALRPLSCASGSRECAARSISFAIRKRTWPHFAWALDTESTHFDGTRQTYVGIGARVYAKSSGVSDPFLELGVGGDFLGRADDVVLASELSFGTSAAITDRIRLSATVELHQQGVSCGACRHWSGWAKRWLTVGVGVEVWLGEKH